MRVRIQSRGFSLSPGLENTVQREAAHFHRLYGHLVQEANVRLFDINGQVHGGIDKCCLIAVSAGRGRSVVASAVDQDLYTAISLAFEKVGRAARHLSLAKRRRHQRISDNLALSAEPARAQSRQPEMNLHG